MAIAVSFTKAPAHADLSGDTIMLTDTSTGMQAHTPHVVVQAVVAGPKLHIVGIGARSEVIVYNISNSAWTVPTSITADDINLDGTNDVADSCRVFWRANANAAVFDHEWHVQLGAGAIVVYHSAPLLFKTKLTHIGTWHIFEVLNVVDDAGARQFLETSSTSNIIVTDEWENAFGRTLRATGIPIATIDSLISGLPAACKTSIDAGYAWAG